MKKTIFSFIAATVAFGLVACNNDGTDTATTTDSITNTTTTTDIGSYAAKADSIRINSEQNVYLNPQTGRPVKLQMDASTGKVTNAETGEPVWRYVDSRNWWVYGGENWDQIGEARLDNNRIMYRSDNDQWLDYDAKWKIEDERLAEEWKIKSGDTKVKVDDDGSMKIKDKDGKTKIDDDGSIKIKDKDGKTKIDEDGKVKTKSDN